MNKYLKVALLVIYLCGSIYIYWLAGEKLSTILQIGILVCNLSFQGFQYYVPEFKKIYLGMIAEQLDAHEEYWIAGTVYTLLLTTWFLASGWYWAAAITAVIWAPMVIDYYRAKAMLN